MIDEQQFELLDMLNDMYYSQSKSFRKQYKYTYIALHDHICQPQRVTIRADEIAGREMIERLVTENREMTKL
jgi:hypothetical protein